MSNAKIIDQQTWPGRESYLFFKTYENPHFNICSKLDITESYIFLTEKRLSKFRAMLWMICTAANSVQEIRYRMRGDQVVEHQQIDPSFTLLNEDKSLTFCNSVYSANPAAFFKNVDKSIAGVAHNPAAADKEANDGMIYASCLPWIDFTSISHPMKVDNTDCIPRISWGKFTCTNNRWFMPVSIQLHHGLADGYHVGLFFEKLEELLKTTDQLNWPL